MNLDDAPDLMTVDQAADLLQVSRWTIYEAVKADELPHLRLRGRTIRISKPGLERMLEMNGDGPNADDVEAAEEVDTGEVIGLRDGR